MIEGVIKGEREVSGKFRQAPARVREALVKSVGRLVLELQARVTKDKLTGQVLKVRTGTLRRSISYVVYERGNEIAGVVGTRLKYGRAHEFGFVGTVQQQVKAHLRRSREQMRAAIKRGKDGSTYVSRKGFRKGEIFVDAHSRTMQMNLPPRSFLASALKDMRDDIVKRLDKAAREAMWRP